MATQADLDQLQTWLAEAKAARHQIALGDKTKTVWRLGGNRREFHMPNLEQIDDYIEGLKSDIRDIHDELGLSSRRRRNAIPVSF